MNNNLKNRKSFTLIEVLVSTTIFVIFVMSITTVFITAQSSQRFLGNFLLTTNNLSFAIERMARELRMGENYSLARQSEIHFTNAYRQDIIYRLNHMAIERSDDGGSKFLPITGDNIEVLNLKFILSGNNSGSQPKITISVEFTSKGGKNPEKYKKTVQTTISSRQLNS